MFKLHSLFAFVLTFFVFAPQFSSAYAVTGCVSVTTATAPTAIGGLGGVPQVGVFLNRDQCATTCSNQNYQYALYLAQPGILCACTNTNIPVNAYINAAALVDVLGAGDLCAALGYEGIKLNTNFNLRACADLSAISSVSTDSSLTVTYIAQCLVNCVTRPYAIFNPVTRLCLCGTGTTVASGGLGLCGQTRPQVYANTALVAPSRRAMSKRAVQKVMGLCPEGKEACLLDPRRKGGVESYECIHTDSELESCGGCLHGVAGKPSLPSNGTDCSHIPGVALGGVTCTAGNCEVFACKRGWHFENDSCVRG